MFNRNTLDRCNLIKCAFTLFLIATLAKNVHSNNEISTADKGQTMYGWSKDHEQINTLNPKNQQNKTQQLNSIANFLQEISEQKQETSEPNNALRNWRRKRALNPVRDLSYPVESYHNKMINSDRKNEFDLLTDLINKRTAWQPEDQPKLPEALNDVFWNSLGKRSEIPLTEIPKFPVKLYWPQRGKKLNKMKEMYGPVFDGVSNKNFWFQRGRRTELWTKNQTEGFLPIQPSPFTKTFWDPRGKKEYPKFQGLHDRIQLPGEISDGDGEERFWQTRGKRMNILDLINILQIAQDSSMDNGEWMDNLLLRKQRSNSGPTLPSKDYWTNRG